MVTCLTDDDGAGCGWGALENTTPNRPNLAVWTPVPATTPNSPNLGIVWTSVPARTFDMGTHMTWLYTPVVPRYG